MKVICNSCQNKDIEESSDFKSFDLSSIPAVDLFQTSKSESLALKRFPLGIYICRYCNLIQIKHSPPPQEFYETYIYESSSSPDMESNFMELVNDISGHLNFANKILKVLDIGCNDGLLLSKIAGKFPNHQLYGTDPSPVSKSTQITKFKLFPEYFPGKLTQSSGPYDLITATNSFAHIPNIGEVTNKVHELLTDTGLFVIEVSDFEQMVSIGAWDYIYHEHLYYYTKRSIKTLLEKSNLSVIKIIPINTKGGSIRVIAKKNVSNYKSDKKDNSICLDSLNQDIILFDKIKLSYMKCLESYQKIDSSLSSSSKVYGYGACATASVTQAQHGLFKKIECIFDDNKKRQNLWAPSYGVQVKALENIIFKSEDIIIVFAWRFIDSISCNIRNYCEINNMPIPKIINSMHPEF